MHGPFAGLKHSAIKRAPAGLELIRLSQNWLPEKWRALLFIGGAATLLAACGAQTIPNPAALKTETPAGNFLAARQALYFNDVEQSADFFLETLKSDANNVDLLRQSFVTQYYYGDIEKAAALGRQLESLNITTTFGREPATALAIRDQDWSAVLVLADKIAETSTSIGLSGLIKGWALIGNGQGDAGITALLEAGRTQTTADVGMPAYFRLHAALMAESMGQNSEAVQRALGLANEPLSTQTAFQLARMLSRNNHQDEAIALMSERLSVRYNKDIVLDYVQRAASDPTPTLIENIAAGVIDTALAGSIDAQNPLFAARLRFTLFLDPNNELARFLLAQQFTNLGKPEQAVLELNRIEPNGVMGRPAKLALFDIASASNDFDKTVKIVSALIKENPEDGFLYKLLGDTLRRDRKFAKSRDAYKMAQATGYETGALLRNLGISLEQLGEDNDAEASLRAALAINPDDPYALNYLGYWWAEEGRNLDEAIALIERAVELRPESGYFVDSLGWVHFRLGDPLKAVSYLEVATELEPADPEIIGHLGDVYWTLGRHEEARFKWRLALSFSTDAAEKKRLRKKLANGYSPE